MLACLVAAGAADVAAQGPTRADRIPARILRVEDGAAPLSHAEFLEIGPALDAARDGDLILVAPGEYRPLRITGKSVILVKQGEGEVVFDHVSIDDLGPGQFVLMRGVRSKGSLSVTDCAGAVWLEHCKMSWLRLESSASCTLASSTVWSGVTSDAVGALSIYESVVEGANGNHGYADLGGLFGSCSGWPGEDGAPGVDLLDGLAFLSGCQVTGGNGGDSAVADGSCCFWAGDGGAGCRVGGGAGLLDVGSVFTGGEHGDLGCFHQAADGVPIEVIGGQAVSLPEPPRRYEIEGLVRAGGSMRLTFDAVPGDTPFVLASEVPLAAPEVGSGLPVLVPLSSASLELEPLPSGQAEVELPAFAVGSRAFGVFFTQSFFRPAGATSLDLVPGPPSAIVVVDGACDALAGFPDCNGNALADDCEIATGLSPDADRDGVPDECLTAFRASSGPLPAARDVPVDFVVPAPPRPSGRVRIRVSASGFGFSSPGDYVSVALNGILWSRLFAHSSLSCETADAKTFEIPAWIWEGIVGGGDAVLTVTPSYIVPCADPWVAVDVAYPRADVDANGNWVDDDFDLAPHNDCDGDGVFDTLQIRRSVIDGSTPFNTYLPLFVDVLAPARASDDVIVDVDLTQQSGYFTLWVNRTAIETFYGAQCPTRTRRRFVIARDRWNGIVGDADASVRVTAPEPSPRGCVDSAVVRIEWVDPALDCNGNGRLDACDIARGVSYDQNGNGVPDECE